MFLLNIISIKYFILRVNYMVVGKQALEDKFCLSQYQLHTYYKIIYWKTLTITI